MNPYAPKRLAVALVGALAPLILAFATFVADEAQTLLHMHLSGASLAAYVSAFLIAVGAVLFRLLEHEASRFLHGLAKLLLTEPLPPASKPTAVVPGPAAPVGTTEGAGQ
jgi:hypothetical protein